MRICSVMLAALMIFTLNICAFAEDDALPTAMLVDPSIPCESAILAEPTTGLIMFEKAPDELHAPASITKVMTLLLVMEALDRGEIALDDIVTCSEHASSMGGSQIWFEPGEEMTVDELLRAAAIASANDAAVALGEHLAGSEEAFVSQMNDRAKELGMVNTTFKNATGLDAEGHLTTARDIMIMSGELLKHKKITEYTTVWMDSLRNGETQLVNTNKLIKHYNGATGLKTGTTDDAKYCLAASAERDGMALVAVVLGAETTNERFGSAKGLLDYGFSEYEMRPLPENDAQIESVAVTGGEKRTVSVTAAPPETVLTEKRAGELILTHTLAESLEAPVKAGDVVGECEVTADGEVLCRYELTAAEDVGKMTLPIAFKMALCAASAMCRVDF